MTLVNPQRRFTAHGRCLLGEDWDASTFCFVQQAIEFGPSVIDILSTELLDDGTAGLWAIKNRRGIAITQDPQTAEYCQCRGTQRSTYRSVSLIFARSPTGSLRYPASQWIRLWMRMPLHI
jgi:hypothetical protein